MGKQYQDKLDLLIQQSKQRVKKIAVPSEYIGFTGNVKNATFLTQFIYWAERATRADGGVFRTNDEWQAELGLTKQEFINARKKLKDLGILSYVKKRAKGHYTNHYYLDFNALEKAFQAYLGLNSEADILDAEIVEENASVKAEFSNKPESIQRQDTAISKTAKKVPMPKDFTPKQETIHQLSEQGYHISLLRKYLDDCVKYYTVKHNHHRYSDWNEAYKRWCLRNPKTDANTERLEQIEELATEDIFQNKTLDELTDDLYEYYYGENSNYQESSDEYGR